MSETGATARPLEPPVDLGEYCRGVEEYLARVNHGHLIRIVGPAFELVRGWALGGVPIGIVYRGIEQKAARHRQGRSTRPLRLEFCEADVRALFDDWRRAVGVTTAVDATTAVASPVIDERRRPSLPKQLDRAIDRLVRAAGRLETAEAVRLALTRLIDDLVVAREDCRTARGDARRAVIERLTAIDKEIAGVARLALADDMAGIVAEAEADLASFRGRLAPEAWQRSLDASIDRLSRDRVGFPTLDLDHSPS